MEDRDPGDRSRDAGGRSLDHVQGLDPLGQHHGQDERDPVGQPPQERRLDGENDQCADDDQQPEQDDQLRRHQPAEHDRPRQDIGEYEEQRHVDDPEEPMRLQREHAQQEDARERGGEVEHGHPRLPIGELRG
jgi:hypothetical protein